MRNPRTKVRLHTALGFAIGLVLLILTGCGKGRGNVHGKVYYKDKALSGGVVAFIADKKTVGTSAIGEDGSYEIRNAAVGEVVITVTAGMPSNPKAAKTPPPVLPKELSDPDKSPEKYTVTTGDQEKDIRIK